MRLCFITNLLHTGGAGKSILLLAQELSQSNDVVILSRTKIPPEYKKNNVYYKRIKSGFFPFCYLSGARDPMFLNYAAWFCRVIYLPDTIRKVRDISPDILVLNGLQSVWYAPVLSKKYITILYARELLNWDNRGSKFARYIINKYINHIVCITANEKKQFDGLRPPCTVIYNSFEGDFNLENSAFKRNNSNEIIIGTFGTIQKIKGQYLIIDLVDKYEENIKKLNIKFYIYGGGSTITTREEGREALLQKVKQKGMEETIKFPGWIADVAGEMRNLDIVLRTDTSGCPWGRDIIEAMSCGKPVIAAGSREEFLHNGISGLLYPPKDIDAMAACVFKLASNSELRSEIGLVALMYAKENFNAQENSQKFINLLEKLRSEKLE